MIQLYILLFTKNIKNIHSLIPLILLLLLFTSKTNIHRLIPLLLLLLSTIKNVNHPSFISLFLYNIDNIIIIIIINIIFNKKYKFTFPYFYSVFSLLLFSINV